MSNTLPNTSPTTGARWGRRAAIGVITSLALLAGGKVLAQGMGMHGGPGMHGGMDPERMAQFGEQRIRKMLSSVNANEAQITQVQGIMRAAMGDMGAIMKEGQVNRQAIGETLAKPTIDRRELERLRGEQMRIADRRSQRMTQAMADAAEVLDPQQRVQLLERMKQHRGRGQRNTG